MYYFNNALKIKKNKIKIDEKYIIKNDLAKIDVLKTYEFMLEYKYMPKISHKYEKLLHIGIFSLKYFYTGQYV